MSQHPGTFLIERPISMAEAVPIPAPSRGHDLELRAQPARLPVPSGPPASEAVPPTPTTKRHRVRAVLTIGASLLALAGAGYFGWQYWTVGRFQVSTDDAYVKADNTTISPKVSGYVSAALVGDNEQVKAGEILATIDVRDFRVALDQAKADVAAAKAVVATKQASLAAQNPSSRPRRRRSASTRRTAPSPSRTTRDTPNSPLQATAAYRMPSKLLRAPLWLAHRSRATGHRWRPRPGSSTC
jgi:membrane fusion protein (multidrug efflux system)